MSVVEARSGGRLGHTHHGAGADGNSKLVAASSSSFKSLLASEEENGGSESDAIGAAGGGGFDAIGSYLMKNNHMAPLASSSSSERTSSTVPGGAQPRNSHSHHITATDAARRYAMNKVYGTDSSRFWSRPMAPARAPTTTLAFSELELGEAAVSSSSSGARNFKNSGGRIASNKNEASLPSLQTLLLASGQSQSVATGAAAAPVGGANPTTAPPTTAPPTAQSVQSVQRESAQPPTGSAPDPNLQSFQQGRSSTPDGLATADSVRTF